jgi:hypothetical protein
MSFWGAGCLAPIGPTLAGGGAGIALAQHDSAQPIRPSVRGPISSMVASTRGDALLSGPSRPRFETAIQRVLSNELAVLIQRSKPLPEGQRLVSRRMAACTAVARRHPSTCIACAMLLRMRSGGVADMRRASETIAYTYTGVLTRPASPNTRR